jgi:TIR domain-containing protein
MAGIFISYRRSDSDVAAGRLADDLAAIFGAEVIFRDVDTLEPGEDYTVALDHALDSCAVLIAMIGVHWSNVTDEAGHPRLQDPADWVRAEIRRALERDVRVIPVLVSATMPSEADVPTDLKPLLQRQALEISDRHWKQDIELLVQVLERIPGIQRRAASGDQSKKALLSSHWIELLLGFSVSVAVGLIPYLGKFVPLFTPMLAIIPDSVQPLAIPLSAAAMGIVAALVQWVAIQRRAAEQSNLWFRRAVMGCVVALVALIAIETFAVVRVDVPAVGLTVSFAVGPLNPGTPPCSSLSRADCIAHQLSLNEAEIDSYFGEGWVSITKFLLIVVYTTFMASFGALVVMLAQRLKLRGSSS